MYKCSPDRIVTACQRGLSICTLALFSVLFTNGAHANPITWNLTNISFTDGTTATGSFVFDADTNTFSGLSMTTSGGGSVPATNSWLMLFFDNAPLDTGFLAVDTANANKEGAHFITFFSTTGPMTDAGGAINLDFFFAGTCYDFFCLFADLDPPFSNSGSGQFTSVVGTAPEPITLSLFGTGLAGAVAVRRRKKKFS